jgi:acetyltransferase-like isoleucine patch superfamily enzyme
MIPFFCLKNLWFCCFGKKIGKKSYIHTPVKFFNLSKIYIGDNTTINPGCYLDGRKGLFIHNNVMIAHDVKMYTLGHDIDSADMKEKGKTVVIEDDAVIFSGAMIMPGVTIGRGAAVYPGAVVTRDVSPYAVVGGNPAQFIRNRSMECNYKLDYNYWFAI